MRWWRGSGTVQGMQQVVETHFWGLTRYRIGRRFLGLDYAGNIIFYPAYRTKMWGGWAAVTLGATSTSSFLTNDTSSVNVLEDGYPLHWRASAKLKAFVAEEKRLWQMLMDEELGRLRDTGDTTTHGDQVNGNSNSCEQGSGRSMRDFHSLDVEQRFRDALTIKCTSPGFAQRHLRVSRLWTALYKIFYFYLCAICISLVAQAYLLFRSWLNPPARQALKNMEAHVIHIPKVIFGFCVSCATCVVDYMHRLSLPLITWLEATFPEVRWRVTEEETSTHDGSSVDTSGPNKNLPTTSNTASQAINRKYQWSILALLTFLLATYLL
ncbi:hypothetical protein TRVL_05081 [Trypanosoma vivax]|nr:hypothetical protein TRVL_05081 [Trypanosoma vivax]